mmetsp:Transcript_44222/g.86794  ORF Transcript_44222/g.86794 Transcript_44222/m.86794 type:complete len:328 (+) Transcript_44222:66-1049(+)|eukprot:CAMPEP_0194324718 /NCGR_PEP_ID=MMETSP0171-20130528/28816_1 /TAXON_ID=218684 /ORGANISM="Corethron pennatum, Strain L29A3" /LENGTH=327 /DNA_ID=CAMNT_0039083683 /DNA_START=59 /DNA_END=1042 /DNA_ORIENTATION=+
MRIYSIVTIPLYLEFVHAIKWPKYNQQCRDDAGPPFPDDVKGKKYYDNQKVIPVLESNGKCAKPLTKACKQHGVPLNAYLEGPIGCKKQGWYCRIMKQDGWPPIGLTGDVNFGHCNSTDSFSDAGYDRDGHCHGSSDDSTYYWWIRDHFNRQYNGRVRCCCGWYSKDPVTKKKSPYKNAMYNRRIGNRCDYRRLVTKTEDITQCRDANEDHGLGFDDIGCNPKLEKKQIGKPIPENDNHCWEMQYFGFSEGGGGGNDDGDGGDDECEDEGGKFFWKIKDGKNVMKTCKWLEALAPNKKTKICQKKKAPEDMDVARTLCWKTCDTCEI